MTKVQFSKYNFRTEEREGKQFIFDEIRRKFVILSSEEWVRQHILQYLVGEKHYPKKLIAVERGIELNGLQKRFDVVVFDNSGKPRMLIECKAPEEKLNEKVFDQIARYNLTLQVDYLWVTNGTLNYCAKLLNGIELLKTVPDYERVNTGK